MGSWNIFIILVLVCRSYGFRQSVFKRTLNMTPSFWDVTKTSVAKSNVHCATHCLMQGRSGTTCNAFKFTKDGRCETASIDQVVDVPKGNISLEIFVSESDLSLLPLLCLGGDSCCQVDTNHCMT
ncbi:uncharacterized protein LOC111703152 [Eurytemora carolleeae]|uniref:uncharacterized protein LOC111703152 n=1 Tax=Eurytemora carolleeae TaxID=1294199 RepID=UPI000C78C5D0|nr:uncharacterized protein LOC111703152 [Eurytemora carolleeae]|eukprot:XP_023330795.1 uncharacterized protein LOC111703152 [Eurytemora affinis]